MTKRQGFTALRLVSAQVFTDKESAAHSADSHRSVKEWTVRTFERTTKAGGTVLSVWVVVVREKAEYAL